MQLDPQPSISFDRAAEYYDATRAFPPGIGLQVARSLAHELHPQTHLLEIGAGTGRIALPVAACGFHLTGIDLSTNMLQKLQENYLSTSESPAFALPACCQADAACLPFPGATFAGVLAVHVLHLVPAWQQALAEIRRVLVPGGSLFVGYRERPAGSLSETIRRQHAQILKSLDAGSERRSRLGLHEIDAALQAAGTCRTEWVAAEWMADTTASQELAKLEERIWSSTWGVSDEIYAASMQALRQWAQASLGDLNRKDSLPMQFIWKRFQW